MTNTPSNAWITIVADSVVGKSRIYHLNPEHTDQLLSWIRGKDGDAQDALTDAFARHSVSTETARQMTLLALDRYLFGTEQRNPFFLLGLEQSADEDEVKTRYRKLMQIYHPDRANFDEALSAKRSEVINHALLEINDIHAGNIPQDTKQPTPPNPEQYIHDLYINEAEINGPRSRKTRQSLGSVRRAFKRGAVIAGLFFFAIIGLFYISSYDEPVQYIANKTPPQNNKSQNQPTVGAMDEPTELVTALLSDNIGELNVSEQPDNEQQGTSQNGEAASAEQLDHLAQFIESNQQRNETNLDNGTATTASSEVVTIINPENPQGQAPSIDPISDNTQTDPTQSSESLTQELPKKSPKGSPEESPDKPSEEAAASTSNTIAASEKANSPSTEKPEPAPKKTIPVIGNKPTPFDFRMDTTIPSPTELGLVEENSEKNGSETIKKEDDYPGIRDLNVREKFISKSVLVTYVDGIRQRNLGKAMKNVADIIIVNGETKSKQRYKSELGEVIRTTKEIKYNAVITERVYVGDNIVKIITETETLYRYESGEQGSYKGPVTYYIIIAGNVGKLIRIDQHK